MEKPNASDLQLSTVDSAESCQHSNITYPGTYGITKYYNYIDGTYYIDTYDLRIHTYTSH
jgi:hypothetical protein